MERGYSVRMNGRVLQLNDRNGMRVARIEIENNRMYKLNLRSMQERCLQVNVDEKVSLWHLRFGHLHPDGLKFLAKRNMVHGLPNIEFTNKFCEECVIGKQTRCSFPKKTEYRATNILELIHTDICGPISPESFSGKWYFITFIDDYLRKTWVYFLKEKLEAFEVFKKFKVMVEKTTSKFIRALQSDRGGEYVSTKFMNFCEEQGIRRCPHAKLENKTPQEAWSGRKPIVAHFKVFGSVAYRHIPDQRRTKLDDKRKKFVFIGHDEKTKAVVEQGKTTSIVELTNNGTNTSNDLPISDDEAEPRNQRTCTLQELYDSTGEQTTMDEEIKAIERNKTWDLVELPSGTQPIRVKWVFTKKMNAQGETERYKARLIAKGYKQKTGIDYDQVFAPVTRIEMSRFFIAQATQFKWPIYQMDVKSAFLNGMLEEDVYVEQPPGYMKVRNEKKVLKLKKALYGLKQAPRARNTRIDTYFKENRFKQCPYEHAMYVKKKEGNVLFVALYVDDLIFMGNNKQMINILKRL
ncbi:retrovirus-related pol polyprotein from transposon TNT 1-94 [Tanacetum coccineum]